MCELGRAIVDDQVERLGVIGGSPYNSGAQYAGNQRWKVDPAIAANER